MRQPKIIKSLGSFSLNVNSPNILTSCFSIDGAKWSSLLLSLKLTIGGSGQASPVADGALRFIKRIVFQSISGEVYYDLTGYGLYRFLKAYMLNGAVYDNITTSTGNYYVNLEMPFALPMLKRPDDTAIFSSRYTGFQLTITTGGLSDLYGTIGSATLSASLNLALVEDREPIVNDPSKPDYKKLLPVFYPYIKELAPINTASVDEMKIESADDLALLGFILGYCTSATAGVPWSGTLVDNIDTLSFYDSDQFYLNKVDKQVFRYIRFNKMLSDVVGVYMYDFIKDGNITEALWCGGNREIKIKLDSYTPGTTPQLSGIIFGIRSLK